MNTQIRVAVLGILSVIAGTLLAEEPTTLPKTTQPKIERVVPAGSLIGSELSSKEHHLGTVSDYVIDLTTGHIALILVTNNDTPVDAPEQTALPSAKVSFDGKEWQLKSKLSETQLAAAKRFAHEGTGKTFHREGVRQLYLALGSEPYWAVTEKERYAPRDQMALWSELRAIKLLDSHGAVAGAIEDIGIAPDHGQIAYAAVDVGQAGVARKSLYAVPLAAFVVPDVKAPWQIELTQVELQNMETFPRDKWPTEVSRGWVEYVHVRYGNSALSGVQTKLKAEATPADTSR
ncbi:MAG TPA: hypothetical protein VMM76_02170 [Pirellulaceae bacterium]|nr:hypothetical protein [Pirellulaceae bacterium]